MCLLPAENGGGAEPLRAGAGGPRQEDHAALRAEAPQAGRPAAAAHQARGGASRPHDTVPGHLLHQPGRSPLQGGMCATISYELGFGVSGKY